jgi:hypothetical protein
MDILVVARISGLCLGIVLRDGGEIAAAMTRVKEGIYI